jgi:hypothetical protein
MRNHISDGQKPRHDAAKRRTYRVICDWPEQRFDRFDRFDPHHNRIARVLPTPRVDD